MSKNVRILVLIPDGVPDTVGEMFDPTGLELPGDLVPVALKFWREIENHLGWAKLSQEADGRVYADIEFFEEPGPALKILFPAIEGRVLEHEGKVLSRVRITRIGLGGKNCDSRIKTLGEQIGTVSNDPASIKVDVETERIEFRIGEEVVSLTEDDMAWIVSEGTKAVKALRKIREGPMLKNA